MADRTALPSNETAQPPMGQWARDIADTYRALAEGETWAQRREALDGAARKYEAIADRMDRITPPGVQREGGAS